MTLLRHGREHYRRIARLGLAARSYAPKVDAMVYLQTSLTPDLVAFLARVQAKTGQSRAALIRQALVWWRAEQWGEDTEGSDEG